MINNNFNNAPNKITTNSKNFHRHKTSNSSKSFFFLSEEHSMDDDNLKICNVTEKPNKTPSTCLSKKTFSPNEYKRPSKLERLKRQMSVFSESFTNSEKPFSRGDSLHDQQELSINLKAPTFNSPPKNICASMNATMEPIFFDTPKTELNSAMTNSNTNHAKSYTIQDSLQDNCNFKQTNELKMTQSAIEKYTTTTVPLSENIILTECNVSRENLVPHTSMETLTAFSHHKNNSLSNEQQIYFLFYGPKPSQGEIYMIFSLFSSICVSLILK